MADKTVTRYNESVGEGYTRIKHKSGLDIYVIPKDHSMSYALFATKFGSCVSKFRLEGEKAWTQIPDGTAHFLEHKMFENEDGEDTFSKFAPFGGESNAYTSAEKTAYLFACTSNEHENLEVLLRFVTSPYFTVENIKKEQGIIGQEIGMYDNDPDWRLYLGALQGMYRSNPVRIDTAGTVDTIATLDPDMLYKCYNSFYDPSNMYLVVCGKFEPEKVVALCDGIIPKSKFPKTELAPFTEPVKANRKKTEINLDVSRPLFTVGVKDRNTDNTGKAAMKKLAVTEILNECLFGPGSAFYCENYDCGLINGTFTSVIESCYAYSHLLISGEADVPDQIFKAIKKTMAEAVEKGIPKADFERCRRVVYSKSILAFDNTEKFANCMLSGLVSGYDALDYPKTVFSVKASEVNARAKELFVEDAMTLSVVRPFK